MVESTRLHAGLIATPCGPMIAVVTEDGALVRLEFVDREGAPADGAASSWHGLTVIRDDGAVAHIARQLGEYFGGARRGFDLKLAPRANAFLQAAWRVLRDVAWEVVPDLAEIVIKDRIRELEQQLE